MDGSRGAPPGSRSDPQPRTAALWWELLPARERFAPAVPLHSDTSASTCVIGGGIAGASLALCLARRGEDVLLLDREFPGWGASGRNAGFLLADSECFAMAAAHLGERSARELHAAGLGTRDFVRSLPAPVTWTGSVRLATDRAEAAWFDVSTRSRLAGLHLASADEVDERGGLAGCRAALVDDGDGMTNPLRLLSAILSELRRRGARLASGTEARVLRERRGSVEIETDAVRIRARRVVVATNSEARRLLDAEVAAIRPVRAQALAAFVDPMPNWRRPCYATRGGDYWRPVGRDRVLLGGLRRLDRRAEATRSTDTSARFQRELERMLRVLVGPDARVEVTHRWAGTMGFTRDGLPRVGPLPGRPRVHLFAGWNGHGMGWAPGFAELVAGRLAAVSTP